MNLKVGRGTPCAPSLVRGRSAGRGLTRPTSAIGWVIALTEIVAHLSAAAELDWPTFRHDHQRTGRAHGVGDIRNPAIIWRQPVGGRRALIELSAQAGELKTLVPFGKEVEPGKFAAAISEWDGARHPVPGNRWSPLRGGEHEVNAHRSESCWYAGCLGAARLGIEP